MPDSANLIGFALVSLGLAVTPGPNMVYLASLSVSHGRGAGLSSLGGVAAGFLIYLLVAALGAAPLLLAHPGLADALRSLGVVYFGYLAWQSWGAAAAKPPVPQERTAHAEWFWAGLTTNLLSPKTAILYLIVLPQFTRPERGGLFVQTLLLGGEQIVISIAMNAMFVIGAGSMAGFSRRLTRGRMGRRLLAPGIFAALAIGLAVQIRL